MSGRYTLADWNRADIPELPAYLEVGGHAVRYSMQTRGLAQDNPGNAGASLNLVFRGYDSTSTGVPGAETSSHRTDREGWADLMTTHFEYAVPLLDVNHPEGPGKPVELDGETVLEVRVYP